MTKLPNTIDTEEDLRLALAQLTKEDRPLRSVLERLTEAGVPVPLRRVEPGFESLLRFIAFQQVSLASAAAIWERIVNAGLVSPEAVLKGGEAAMLANGFSRPKARYGLALAKAVSTGALDLDGLATADDVTASTALMSVSGIGRWTADLYLLSALGRPDIWPAGDIALRTATGHALGLQERPEEADMAELAANWRPYRSVAARLLWAFYTLKLPQK